MERQKRIFLIEEVFFYILVLLTYFTCEDYGYRFPAVWFFIMGSLSFFFVNGITLFMGRLNTKTPLGTLLVLISEFLLETVVFFASLKVFSCVADAQAARFTLIYMALFLDVIHEMVKWMYFRWEERAHKGSDFFGD